MLCIIKHYVMFTPPDFMNYPQRLNQPKNIGNVY